MILKIIHLPSYIQNHENIGFKHSREQVKGWKPVGERGVARKREFIRKDDVNRRVY